MNTENMWQFQGILPGTASPSTSSCTLNTQPGCKANVRLCQAMDCEVDLIQEGRAYNIKRNCCSEHIRADSVQRKGHEGFWRFCFQCGKLEPLSEFDGAKRSCRARLQKRKAGPVKRRSTWACSNFATRKQLEQQSADTVDDQTGVYADLMPELFEIEEQQHQQLLSGASMADTTVSAAAAYAAACGQQGGSLSEVSEAAPALSGMQVPRLHQHSSLESTSLTGLLLSGSSGLQSSHVQRRRALPARAASVSNPYQMMERKRSFALERNSSSGSDGMWATAAATAAAAQAGALMTAAATAELPGSAAALAALSAQSPEASSAVINDVYSSLQANDDLERILEYEMAAAAAAAGTLEVGSSPCHNSSASWARLETACQVSAAGSDVSNWLAAGTNPGQMVQAQHLQQQPMMLTAGSCGLPPVVELPCMQPVNGFSSSSSLLGQQQVQPLVPQQALVPSLPAVMPPAVTSAAAAAAFGATTPMPMAPVTNMQAAQQMQMHMHMQLQQLQMQMHMQQAAAPTVGGQMWMASGMNPAAACLAPAGTGTGLAATSIMDNSPQLAQASQVQRLQVQYQEVKALLDQAQRLIAGCLVNVQNA